MKVIDVDMWGRETVADTLVKDNLTQDEAQQLVTELNHERTEHNSSRWAQAVKDDYRLSRGMEDLV